MNVFDYEKVKDPLYFADGCVEAHSDHRYYGSVAELADGEERFKESLNGHLEVPLCKELSEYGSGL